MEANNSKDARNSRDICHSRPLTEKTMFATAKATIAIKIIQAKVVTPEKQGLQYKLEC
jgi:hypothetical protein